MGTCAACGNEYDKTFTVTTADNRSYAFDSVECAAQTIAPTCGHCGIRILGHGVESDSGGMFCCAACARRQGVEITRA